MQGKSWAARGDRPSNESIMKAQCQDPNEATEIETWLGAWVIMGDQTEPRPLYAGK